MRRQAGRPKDYGEQKHLMAKSGKAPAHLHNRVNHNNRPSISPPSFVSTCPRSFDAIRNDGRTIILRRGSVSTGKHRDRSLDIHDRTRLGKTEQLALIIKIQPSRTLCIFFAIHVAPRLLLHLSLWSRFFAQYQHTLAGRLYLSCSRIY